MIRVRKVFILLIGVQLLHSLAYAVNIEGIDRAKLVQELYKNAKSPGNGATIRSSEELPLDVAKDLVGKDMDYVAGRVMKIEVPRASESNELDTFLYNRDNGENAAEKVVSSINKSILKTTLSAKKESRPEKSNKFYSLGFEDLLRSDLPIRIFASGGRLGQYFFIVDTVKRSYIGGHGNEGFLLNHRQTSGNSLFLKGETSVEIETKERLLLKGIPEDMLSSPKDKWLEEVDYNKLTLEEIALIKIIDESLMKNETDRSQNLTKKIDLVSKVNIIKSMTIGTQISCKKFFQQ